MKFTHCTLGLLLLAMTSQAQFVPVDPLPEDASRVSGGRVDARLGESVINVGDMNGDGRDDFAIAAPDADIVYIIFGRNNLPRTLNLNFLGPNGFPILGEVGTQFGATLSAVGDVNRDGLADLAIGAPFAGEGGKIYVLRGGFTLSRVNITNTTMLLYTVEGTSGENLGSLLCDGGDINNDGFSELLIPSPSRFITIDGENSIGAAYIIYGAFSFSPNVLQTDSLDPEQTLTLVAEPTRSTNNFATEFQVFDDFTGDGIHDVGMVAGINVVEEIIKNDLLIFSGIGRPRGVQVVGQTDFPIQFFSFKFFDTLNGNMITQMDSTDLDEDGLNDLVLGFPFGDGPQSANPAGSIAIVPGSILDVSGRLIDRTQPVTFLTTNLDNALFGNTLSVSHNIFAIGLRNAINPLDPNSSPGLTYLIRNENLSPNSTNIAEETAHLIYIGKQDQSQFGASVDLTHNSSGTFVISGSTGDPGEDTNGDGFPNTLGTGAFILPTELEATGIFDFTMYD